MYRKNLDKRGGGVPRFSVEKFLSPVPKKFVVEPFIVPLISGTQKVWIGEGGGSIKIFRRNFFVSQCRKISHFNPSLLQ